MCSMPSCLRARPTWVRQVLSTGSPALGGVEVMAAPVGVEGRKQSMRRNGLLETDEASRPSWSRRKARLRADQVPRRGHSGQSTCQKNGAAKGAPRPVIKTNPEAGLGAGYV